MDRALAPTQAGALAGTRVPPCAPGGPPPGCARARRRRGAPPPPRAGFLEDAAAFFERELSFEAWAPRSSQAWRLRQQAPREGSPPAAGMTDADVRALNERLAAARAAGGPPPAAAAEAPAPAPAPAGAIASASDADLAAALGDRISAVAAGAAGPAGGDGPPLDGAGLAALLLAKYGREYDVAFSRRDVPGRALVSLNILWHSAEQRSFPMTRRQYLEKLDAVALALRALGQDGRVAAFLREPVRPRGGLPSRPVVGSAVNIPLALTPEQVAEFFGRP